MHLFLQKLIINSLTHSPLINESNFGGPKCTLFIKIGYREKDNCRHFTFGFYFAIATFGKEIKK